MLPDCLLEFIFRWSRMIKTRKQIDDDDDDDDDAVSFKILCRK